MPDGCLPCYGLMTDTVWYNMVLCQCMKACMGMVLATLLACTQWNPTLFSIRNGVHFQRLFEARGHRRNEGDWTSLSLNLERLQKTFEAWSFAEILWIGRQVNVLSPSLFTVCQISSFLFCLCNHSSTLWYVQPVINVQQCRSVHVLLLTGCKNVQEQRKRCWPYGFDCKFAI